MRDWLLLRLVIGLVDVIRLTCRIRFHDDPRPELKRRGIPYVYGALHGHQLAVICDVEPGIKAMVSRSRDGELIAPALQRVGMEVVRGSTRSNRQDRQDRGGKRAIEELAEHVQSGGSAAITVDGPRGPRGCVQKGIAWLSQQTGAAVLLLAPIPRRRLIAFGSWDRLQIPLPGTRIDGYFAEPIFPRAGEKLETYRQRIETRLRELERQHDPKEAIHNRSEPAVEQAELPARRVA